MPILSSTHPLAHTTAYAISALGTSLGIFALFNPRKFAANWGLSSHASSPLFYVLGGRNVALGLVLLNFTYHGKLKDVGAVLMCIPVTGAVDAWVTWRFGERGMWWVHVLPGVGIAGLGLYLIGL